MVEEQLKKVSVGEVRAKTVLSKSGIPGADYCINPYTGCTHGCAYCYATFMKKYTGHTEEWGTFVDAKVNAPEVLDRQLRRSRKGSVILSSVTDPYQPVEAEYRLTRRCIEILCRYQWPVHVLTKSPLVLRDIDLLARFDDLEVGLTVTTDDDAIRRLFEPGAPPIADRIEALRKLRRLGIRTYAFIGPLLPMDPDILARELVPAVSYVFIDRMNYLSKTRALFEELDLSRWLDRSFTQGIIERLRRVFDGKAEAVC
jgi:DNA repair photolyase